MATMQKERLRALPAVERRELTAIVKAGRSSQRTRIWCPTGTAQRKRTAGVVRVVDPRTEE